MALMHREQLDRLAVSCGGRVGLGCTTHPKGGTDVLYQDGEIRVLCHTCGFEAMRVKVAEELTEEPELRDGAPH